MDTQVLEAFIRDISKRTTDEDVTLIMSHAISRSLKKGEVLLKEGDVCRSFYFVNKGYLRTYYNKDGAIINLNFTFEGQCTTNLISLKSREKSEYIIEAGEDTDLWIYDLDSIVMLESFNMNSAALMFVRRLAIRLLLVSEEYSNLFKTHTPTERYRYIEKNNPRLLQRISLSQIASYLGVTRETLSRIRAKKT